MPGAMDKPRLRTFSSSSTGGGGGPGGGGVEVQYSQIGGSDSDDSRSSISRSEDTDGVPGITYTSDDSAEVVPSDSGVDSGSCGIDSDTIGYIGGSVQIQDDEVSQRLLLDSECPSPQPSPQPAPCFTLTHPLATMAFTSGSDCNLELANDPHLGLPEDSQHHAYAGLTHLGPHPESRGFERSSSVSSASSGSSPGVQQPLLPEYEALAPEFPLHHHHHHHHHHHFTSLEYEPLEDQHDPLTVDTAAAAAAGKKMLAAVCWSPRIMKAWHHSCSRS